MPYGQGGSRAWRRVRTKVLERDSHHCQLNYPGCTGRATQVDHKTNLAALGIPRNDPRALNPDDCQAVCEWCHTEKTRRERAPRVAEANRRRAAARRKRLTLPNY
ncbi:hypothetical protein NJBCHELONAE_48630 [Mycobacteroides chelonae]|nr:hypothetical protein NJBCHELONAE_48630 [Mycobacteroides chelonae]